MRLIMIDHAGRASLSPVMFFFHLCRLHGDPLDRLLAWEDHLHEVFNRVGITNLLPLVQIVEDEVL